MLRNASQGQTVFVVTEPGSDTIFDVQALARDVVRWEDYLYELTPVEVIEGVAFKREDRFAPLGYGGINGAKLRQLIWLLEQQHDAAGVLTGCSVLSPQASMTALVGRHYGLPVELVLGATSYESAARHENVAIAIAAGAGLHFAPVAYNPALQGYVARMADDASWEGWYRLAYAITPPAEAPDEDVEAFHAVGAAQVANLPERPTLVMSAGSCNSCTSVIYGLARMQPDWLKRLVLVQVGPGRHEWLQGRLELLQTVSGIDVLGFMDDIQVEWLSLRDEPYGKYADRASWSWGDLADGIDFHPTYEGKMMRYLHEQRFDLSDATVWVVGSHPTRAAMRQALYRTGWWDGSAAALLDR